MALRTMTDKSFWYSFTVFGIILQLISVLTFLIYIYIFKSLKKSVKKFNAGPKKIKRKLKRGIYIIVFTNICSYTFLAFIGKNTKIQIVL